MQKSIINGIFKTGLCLSVIVLAAALINSISIAQEGELKYLEVKIVDDKGKPMADVDLEIMIDNIDFPMASDEEGIVPLNVSADGSRLRISVKHDGYVAQGTRWNRGDKIPDDFTIPMKKGATIGGIVHDEQGNPVEGVQVEASTSNYSQKVGELYPMFSGTIATTDSEGRWKTTTAPDDSAKIYLRFVHDDFIKEEGYGQQQATRKQLDSLEHIFTLKKGIELSGIIADTQGNPIPNARVFLGTNRYMSNRMDTTSDKSGKFTLKNVPAGANALTVSSEEFAPEVQSLIVKRDMDPINFELQPGNTIRIRMVDSENKPLAGVNISQDSWRGYETLGDPNNRAQTDNQGIWQWNGAPTDPITYSFTRNNYMSVRSKKLAPQDEEHVIVMPDPLLVKGKVIDAETRQAIPEFKVVQGIRWDQRRENIHWERYNVKPHSDGEYLTEFTFPRFGHLVRIEAEGYRPGVSRLIHTDEGKITIDFELEVGTGPTGIVTTPDGAPAEGASVSLGLVNEQVHIHNGHLQPNSNTQLFKTDSDGRYTLPFPDSAFLIVCVHESGWAQVNGDPEAESQDIHLQAWAKVEGRLLRGKEPLADENINVQINRIYQQNQPNVYWGYNAKSAADGTFSFDRVKSGTAILGQHFTYADTGNGGRMGAISHNQQVELKPGQTKKVQLGGTGRILQGKLAAPEDYQDVVPWDMGVVLLHEQQASVVTKNAIQALGKAIAQLGQSKSQPSRPIFRRTYAAPIAEDGSYKVFDVPPGQYSMNVQIYARPTGNNFRWHPMARFNQNITVQEGDQIYELGKQVLTIQKPPPPRPVGQTGTIIYAAPVSAQ